MKEVTGLMLNLVQQLDVLGDEGKKVRIKLKSGDEVVGIPWYIDTDYADEDTIVVNTTQKPDGNYFIERCINSEIESFEVLT